MPLGLDPRPYPVNEGGGRVPPRLLTLPMTPAWARGMGDPRTSPGGFGPEGLPSPSRQRRNQKEADMRRRFEANMEGIGDMSPAVKAAVLDEMRRREQGQKEGLRQPDQNLMEQIIRNRGFPR